MAITIPSTNLSAGKIIFSVLNGSAELKRRINKVFPVVASQDAVLPYIRYCRTGLSSVPQKSGQPATDTTVIVVECYTADYIEGVELAEIVRSLLDHKKGEACGMTMRSCTLVDSAESWENDAYIQELTFQVKI
jgi:hypothetical protein